MPKRPSASSPSELAAQPAKKQRLSPSTTTILALPRESLHALPAGDLVNHVEELQIAVRQLQSQLSATETTALKSASSNVSTVEDPKMVAEKAHKFVDIMAREIKKQMKWAYVCPVSISNSPKVKLNIPVPIPTILYDWRQALGILRNGP